MPTAYPAALDAYGDPSGGQVMGLTTPTHSGHHTNHNDAIEAIEAKLGTVASTPAGLPGVLRSSGGGSAWGQLQTVDIAANAVTQRPASATGTTNPTTTSSSVVAFADPTITLTTGGTGSVDIIASATLSCTAATNINLWYRVDGGTWVFLGETTLAANGRSQVFGFDRVSGLSAASHLFEIGWATTAPTATSLAPNRKMQVTELRK